MCRVAFVLLLAVCCGASQFMHQARGAQGPTELVAAGNASLTAGNEEEALKSFSDVLRAEPANVGAKVGRAEIAMRRELYPQAIAGFSAAVAAEPNSAAHYARRAAAYAGDLQYAPAVADWTLAIERDAKQPAYLVGRGDAYLAQKNTDAALTDYIAAVRGFPDYLPGFLRLARTQLRVKKDLSRAASTYTDALRIDPKCVEALVGRGDTYLQDEQYSVALRDLTQAVELKKDDAPARSLRGDVELLHGHYKESVADYRKAVELEPRNALFHCDLGCALVRSEDYAGAIKSLKRSAKLDPKMSRAFIYLAVAEFSQGNQSAAQAALDGAKKLDDKWKDAKLERRHSRFIAFANGTDKPVEVKVWYFTDAIDGRLAWYPAEPGQGEPITHKIKAHDTLYPAYKGMRLPVAKLRFTVRADDGSFTIDRFQNTDLDAAPTGGYIDTAPQTFSFPIVLPEK
ncbi:MAG: tetratricopeptide repeat protein [Planctomycetia bacterium]|nr:tetratricopeptide repeat protein [Planctomycetia bacterium]